MNMLSLAPLALGGLLTVYALDGIIRKGLLKEKAAVQYNQKSDARMGRILGRMDSVLSGYAPTFWAHGSYTQLGLLLLWKAVHNNTVRFKTHTVQCPDGGVVHIEEFVEPEGATELPVNAPIVLILHTIGGTAADESEFCKEAYARGMRAMVLARRGHAAPLVTAKFNFMGCTKDTTLMVQRVKQLYPESFIGMVGLSAGSGQCVSYIGQQGDTQPVQAAVSLCPAYDISKAFHKFQEQSPLLAKWLLQGLKKFFLRNNYTLMKATHEDRVDTALESRTVQELFETCVEMAGYSNYEEYLEDSNPMVHYHHNKVPCLVLNALDDPLCVEENIRYDIVETTQDYTLVTTRSGSHVAYREGILGQTCYMHRIALDFLESSKLELEQNSHQD